MSKGGIRPNAGRPKGTPNQLTKELREVYSEFITNNQDTLQSLFDKIAKENPSKAIDVILKMSEFVIPKIKQNTNINKDLVTNGFILGGDKHHPPIFGSSSLDE